MIHAFILSTNNHLSLYSDILRYFDKNGIEFMLINLKQANKERSREFIDNLALSKTYQVHSINCSIDYFKIRDYVFGQKVLQDNIHQIRKIITDEKVSKLVLANDIGFFEKWLIRFSFANSIKTFLIEEGFVDYNSRNSFFRQIKYFITRALLRPMSLDHYGSNKYGAYGVDYALCKSKNSLGYFNRIKRNRTKLLLVGYSRVKDKENLLDNVDKRIQANLISPDVKRTIVFFTSGIDGQLPGSHLGEAEMSTIDELFKILDKLYGSENFTFNLVLHVDSNPQNFNKLACYKNILFTDRSVLQNANVVCFTFFSSVIYELAYNGFLVFWLCLSANEDKCPLNDKVFSFRLYRTTTELLSILDKYDQNKVREIYLQQNSELEEDIFMTKSYSNNLIGDTIIYL